MEDALRLALNEITLVQLNVLSILEEVVGEDGL